MEYSEMNVQQRAEHLLADLKAWDVEQYLTIPHELRERIQRELTHNAEVTGLSAAGREGPR